jgi:hypothetical protein
MNPIHATLIAFGVLAHSVSAAFEKWTLKNGRSFHIEFIRMVQGEGQSTAEFKRLNGTTTTLKVADLIDAHASRLLSPESPSNQAPEALPGIPLLRDTIEKQKAGKSISPSDIESCRNAYDVYHQSLHARYQTDDHHLFPEPGRIEYYYYSGMMALIDPEKFGTWPTHEDYHLHIYTGLKKRADKDKDPFTLAFIILPALTAGDQQYAAEAMNTLTKQEPLLAAFVQSRLKAPWIESPAIREQIAPFLKATGLK